MKKIKRRIGFFLLIFSLILSGCSQKIGDYTAASDISRDGFAIDPEKIVIHFIRVDKGLFYGCNAGIPGSKF